MRKRLEVACIGDSLTAGISGYFNSLKTNSYQYWLHKYLATESKLWKENRTFYQNYGVPGAVISQIQTQTELLENPDWAIIMGGTNDFWMFSHPEDQEQNRECIEHVISTLEKIILEVKERVRNTVLCSVPPVKIGTAASQSMHENILKSNQEIKGIAQRQNGVIFCDIHGKMSGRGGQMNPELCQTDGVHFSLKGNKSCGEEIAKSILSKLQ